MCFVLILYLNKFIWKNQEIRFRKHLLKNTSLLWLLLFSIIIGIIGLISYLLISDLFTDVLAVSRGGELFAFHVGTVIGIILIYSIIIQRKEKASIKDFPSKVNELVSGNPIRSLTYGIISAILLTIAISSISDWSQTTTFPTMREIGTIIGLTFTFFPLLFIKEFYLRTVQSKLNFSNRFKEYFSMVFIGIFIENIVIVPITLLTWGSPNHELSFISLSLTVTFIMSVIQQILVTWVYMYSGRNIVGSTIFLSIFYSWIIINFFPFT